MLHALLISPTNPAPGTALKMVIYTPIEKCKLILCTSPKCACQTISRIALRIFTHPFFKTYQLGGPSEDPQRLEAQRNRFNNVVDPSFNKLITTRHPVKRILSCYNYMILGTHRYPQSIGGEKWFKSPLEKSTGKSLWETTFTEFIDYIYSTPDHLRDIHFSTQSFLAEDITFDKIIKLESFIQDLEEAISEFNIPIVLPKQIQRNKTNYARFNKKELTPDTLDKIHEIYAKDFKKFGYNPMNPKEAQNYITSKSLAGPVHQGRIAGQSRKFTK